MGELKTTETELNVNALLSNIPEGNIKKDSIIILELIKEVTNKSPKIWGDNSIIGFGNYSYFRKNNKTEFKWFNIGFAPRKNKITLYLTCDLTKREEFLKKMGKCKWGKGCLHINKLDDIDLKMLKQLVIEVKDNSYYS
ncbi:DUF1801 domain-containing protein [Flavobacteriaceae bacterium]|jgi:hypothetical protein|nr:DUF1801 domain-containing protein [Flavobacteriaceae bacterium]MDB4189945.1 DUF1801 domain-containing protein [bacterium]MDB9893986.1 DUF1801 domain-containing protein [Flavobacteriaceae bacterium]MDC1342744.1 DUF1801 domain-containing protein [Flavobacteriaceae bacterium]|tara:strand:+ start:414 stop:830 length:417 start_codon:yes stop_codon:yes gene_type:complete